MVLQNISKSFMFHGSVNSSLQTDKTLEKIELKCLLVKLEGFSFSDPVKDQQLDCHLKRKQGDKTCQQLIYCKPDCSKLVFKIYADDLFLAN